MPSGSNYCAEGPGSGVFTQPGPNSDISGSTSDLQAIRFTVRRCANNQDKTPCRHLSFAYCRQCFKEVFYWNSFPGLWVAAPDYRYPILPCYLAKFSVHPFPICPPWRHLIPVKGALKCFGCQEILACLNELNKAKAAFLGQCWHSRTLYPISRTVCRSRPARQLPQATAAPEERHHP